MKFLLFLTFISPKSDTLPSTEKLFESIQIYYQQVANAELLEFKESTKGEWLKYIPNLGFGYSLGTKEIEGETKVVGKLRPSISFNTGIIYTARKDKQLRAAKIKSIESSIVLLIQQEQRKLLQLIGNYEQELRSLAVATEIQEIEDAIFEIQETKFKNRELTPLEYLPIKRGYLQKEYELAEKRKGIDFLVGEILFLGKWGGDEWRKSRI